MSCHVNNEIGMKKIAETASPLQSGFSSIGLLNSIAKLQYNRVITDFLALNSAQ
jgi:hypothetical protein